MCSSRQTDGRTDMHTCIHIYTCISTLVHSMYTGTAIPNPKPETLNKPCTHIPQSAKGSVAVPRSWAPSAFGSEPPRPIFGL